MSRMTVGMSQDYVAMQSAILSRGMMEQQTSSPYQDSRESNSGALVHVITPADFPDSIHLSILPSFLSSLPPSIHMLRISCDLSRQSGGRDWVGGMPPRFWHISLEQAKNVVDKDGTINLHITVESENVSVTFLDVEGHASTVEGDVKSELDPLASYGDPFTRSFPLLRENAIFTPLASYSRYEVRFLPIGDVASSSLAPLRSASVVQLSVPPPDVIPCSISRLPVELLSLIFSFSNIASTVSKVSKLWREVSAPYWGEPGPVVEKYKRLKRYPSAGRPWDTLRFDQSLDVGLVKEVIGGLPNVTIVSAQAFWTEVEANTVLNAIEGLKRLHDVTFWPTGFRKWRKEEIENFMLRMGDRIRQLEIFDVEDSPASVTAGLHLSSRLEHLHITKYPPHTWLSLPHSLRYLWLFNLCPLHSCISHYPLPPLLEHLIVVLSPFSVSGKTSTLPIPFDLSHLTHLTAMDLDGGEETSNLVSRQFFSTLKNATLIHDITVKYCVVDPFDFPDIIRWFFGDWRDRGVEKGDQVDGKGIGWHLEVRLFFGEWSEEEIVIARSMMGKYTSSPRSGIWESGD